MIREALYYETGLLETLKIMRYMAKMKSMFKIYKEGVTEYLHNSVPKKHEHGSSETLVI